MIHTLCSPTSRALRHCRVLVVEDEALVAMTIEEELLEAGAVVLGPHATLGDALRRIETESGAIDLAVLDLNLEGVSSLPVAAALARRRIPFVVATGYGADTIPGYADAPVLGKPFGPMALVRSLAGLLPRVRKAGRPMPV